MNSKFLRYFTFILCFIMLVQMGQFGVFAEEIVKEDGTVIVEIPTEDGTVDGGGTDNGGNSTVVTDKVSFGEHTYQVVITSPAGTWESAKAGAEAQGGHLATVTSQAEHDFLMTITGGRNLWIGGYRDDSYNWYWVTGEKWDYTNWADGEPNDSSNVVKDEKYAALWPDLWNDLANANVYEQNGYVIEWEKEDSGDPGVPVEPGDPENPEEPGEPGEPGEPAQPGTPSKPKKKKKPDPPKQIKIQRAKGIIKGYCKKNLRVFAIIKNKTYKTVANKKGRFKFNVPKIKVPVVRLYCKSKEGVKSKVVKAVCKSMISKKEK